MSLSNDSPQLWISSGVGLQGRKNSNHLQHTMAEYLTVNELSSIRYFMSQKLQSLRNESFLSAQ
jgi:hypothetical protein